VGKAGTYTLYCDAGRDVLIGGLGADNINGGTDDDLLINGTTFYDANVPALQAIMNEWASANSYATRINNLRLGAGLSAGNYLQAAGAGRTVFDDGTADNQTGGAGLDWFFTGTGDAITDLGNGGPETVN
jgi:Ca2+-binding RTX toxin-like protein